MAHIKRIEQYVDFYLFHYTLRIRYSIILTNYIPWLFTDVFIFNLRDGKYLTDYGNDKISF